MKIKRRRRSQRVLQREQISITGEADYIIRCAANHETHILTLGPLVFFSTGTGDAWMLDPQDGLALCLARDGDRQPFVITETQAQFAVEWNSDYQIEGGLFVVSERESGRTRTIMGYPVQEILKATRKLVA